MKGPIAENHFNLIDEFISKYGHRFGKTGIDSWGLMKKHGNYPKLCQKLGVECVKDDSQSFESSDSFNERTKKLSNTSNSRNAHEKVELTPFMCCSKCSGQNLCAVCHKSSVTNNPVYVCKRHKSSGPNCPICHIQS